MMEDLDTGFKFEVAEEPGGGHIKRCFACGTCTAVCPVFTVNDQYNPRKIIRMILLGLKEEVLKNDFIWLCSGCYSCYELCPRDIKITRLMAAVRNIAVREGHLPKPMKLIVKPNGDSKSRPTASFIRLSRSIPKTTAAINCLPLMFPCRSAIAKAVGITDLEG